MQAIILNRKEHDAAKLEKLRSEVEQTILRDLGEDCRVMTAKEDFLTRGETLGFRAWIEEIALGTNPEYTLYIVPDMIIGKATADILDKAGPTKDVVYTSDGKEFKRVVGFEIKERSRGRQVWTDFAMLKLE